MLAQAAYVLVAVLVTSALLGTRHLALAGVLAAQVLLPWGLQLAQPRMPRGLAAGTAVAVGGGAFAALALQAQAPGWVMAAGLGLLLSATALLWMRPWALPGLLAVVGPAGALLVLAGIGPAAAQAPPVAWVGAWCLAGWPLLAVLMSPRAWWPVAVAGPLAALGFAIALLQHLHHPLELLGLALGRMGASFRGSLAAALAVVVVTAAAPLVIHAEARWRWLLGLGAAALVLTGGLVQLTGPWLDGLPLAGIVALAMAAAAMAAAFLAILATVDHRDLVRAVMVRLAAMGAGAAATAAVTLWEQPPRSEHVVQALGSLLVPAVLGAAMAALVGAAGLAGRRLRRKVDTERIAAGWRQVQSQVLHRQLRQLRGVVDSVLGEAGQWLAPVSLVSLVTIGTAWPALAAIGGGALAVLLVLPALLWTALAGRWPLLWAMGHTGLVVGAALSLGLPLGPVGLGAGLALVIAWACVRWSELTPAWAFPGAVVLLVTVLVLAGYAGLEPLLATVVLLLIANGLHRGPARWLLLVWTAVALAVELLRWIGHHDPYASVSLSERSSGAVLAELATSVPLVAVPLAVLWTGRLLGTRAWPGSQAWLRPAAFIAAAAAAAVWAVGLRPGLLGGVLAWAALLSVGLLSLQRLPPLRPVELRLPALDALAMALAILAAGAGRVVALHHDAVAAGTHLPAGSLAAPLLNALIDLTAIAIAAPLVAVLRGLVARGLPPVIPQLGTAVLGTMRIALRKRSKATPP